MNKDVIYIEPEDDITDIINSIKQSKQKVVALVPPKKPGALRSTVNIKLVSKVSRESEKAVVIVTMDPGLTKIAGNAGLPVAENLQSRPVLPSENAYAKSSHKDEDIIEEITEEKPIKAEDKIEKLDKINKSDKLVDTPDIHLNSSDIDSEKDNASAIKIPNFKKYRKWIIGGSVTLVLLICFSVWAFIFAPSAKVIVTIKTAVSNFSENVTFTEKLGEEANKEGKFLLEQQKITKESVVEFEATGKKDVGEKASGEVVAYAYLRSSGSYNIPAGSVFRYGTLTYSNPEPAKIAWDGSTASQCDNASNTVNLITSGCLRTIRIKIFANKPGEDHNLDPKQTGWNSGIQGVYLHSDVAISGGTTKNIAVVQQSDIDKAKEKLTSDLESSKNELIAKVGADSIVIESSFKATSQNPVSTPALGEEVKDKKPTLKAVTEYSIYGVDKTAVEEYIKATVEKSLAEDQKYYKSSEPFFERFLEGTSPTAKLKAIAYSGPKITEADILEKAKGKKIGELQSQLKSINGVSGVQVDTSYFWVYSVPNDANKVSVELKIEE